MSKRNKPAAGAESKSMQAGTGAGSALRRYRAGMIVIGVLIVAGSVLFFAQSARQAGAVEMTVYKSPTCKCCDKWIDHMRDAGFKVTARNSDNLEGVKSYYGIMPGLRSCHTALVEGYVVEGHVPATDIKRLLQERPDVAGLAAPGMPMGSPGMEGPYTDPYNVLAFDQNGQATVYATH